MKKLFKILIISTVSIYAQAIPATKFKNVTNQKGLVVIDLWAPWCGNCKVFKPTYDSVKRKLQHRVKFYEINTDPVDDPFTTFGIKYGLPAVLLYKNGVRVGTKEGGMSEEEFISWIKKYQ